MTTNNEAFEKFLADLDFQDIAHDTESIRNLYLRAWQAATAEANERIAELKASNNHLRELLKRTTSNYYLQKEISGALSATPAESLQALKEVK